METASVEHLIWLGVLGFLAGTFGTLIGAGGGFVLMPILLLLYPKETPEILTSISLAVVFFNAGSGSAAYARMKRIDYRSALMFAVATIPGAILGAVSSAYIPRHLFNGVFGAVLIAVSAFLLARPGTEKHRAAASGKHSVSRTIVDASGVSHTFSFNPITGVVLSVFVGYISSALGIGGGIIHVPAMVRLLDFPVHVATATSHFILAVMALTGTIVHIVTGTFTHGIHRTVALVIGVLPGAQLGAVLSNRVQGDWIIRGLAIALGFVGVRILFMAF